MLMWVGRPRTGAQHKHACAVLAHPASFYPAIRCACMYGVLADLHMLVCRNARSQLPCPRMSRQCQHCRHVMGNCFAAINASFCFCVVQAAEAQLATARAEGSVLQHRTFCNCVFCCCTSRCSADVLSVFASAKKDWRCHLRVGVVILLILRN